MGERERERGRIWRGPWARTQIC